MASLWRKRFLCSLVLCFFEIVFLNWVLPKFIGRPFDETAWKDPELVKQGVRLEMADWFIKWGTLHGKSKQEVIEMLGDPSTSKAEPPLKINVGNWDFTYYLGPERYYFSSDAEWLSVRFGQEGRVAEIEIHHFIW